MGSVKKHGLPSLACGRHSSFQNVSIQLFQCAHDKLDDLMLANDPRLIGIKSKSDEYVAKMMESVAKAALGWFP